MGKTDKPRVLIDSSALISIIKDEPGAALTDDLMALLDRGEAQLIESVIVLAEVYKRSADPDRAIRRRHDSKLDAIRNRLESPEVLLLDVTPPIARKAAEYRLRYGLHLPDAIHLATAVLNKCDWLVTFDDDFPPREGDVSVIHLENQVSATVLPWIQPVQGDLFDGPDHDNVVPFP